VSLVITATGSSSVDDETHMMAVRPFSSSAQTIETGVSIGGVEKTIPLDTIAQEILRFG
jgi:hypothetical protein